MKENGHKSAARGLFCIIFLWAWAVCVPAFSAALPLIPVPKMVPPGETGWVGSTRFTFQKPTGGKIYYTLDGSKPDNRADGKNMEWKEGYVTVTKTTTVRAVHYLAGLPSDLVSEDFIRAKLPAPTAR